MPSKIKVLVGPISSEALLLDTKKVIFSLLSSVSSSPVFIRTPVVSD